MSHLLALLAVQHVPTYGGAVENCFTPPRVHTTSQVIYVKGSGGLEIHCSADDCPFGWNETLDVDAVFRDEVDQSTYSLFIGCGGCVATADPIVIAPVQLNGYQPAVIEPFTQTRYSSVFPKHLRKYNASGIHPSVCDQGHITIRLVDFMNRTGEHEAAIVWGAVIGLAETFTFEELMLFPVFVLRNHGDTWNEQGWTFWATLFIFAPLTIMLWRSCLTSCGFSVLRSMPVTMKFEKGRRRPVVLWRPENPRVALYEIAVIAFVAVMLEEFIHLNIAAQGVEPGSEYWVGLLVVILFSNGLPLWQVLTSWGAIEYKRPDPDLRLLGNCRHRYWTCAGSSLWAPWEFLFGFSYFLLFGSGFYLGPTMICLAALVRMGELSRRGKPERARPTYRVRFEVVDRTKRDGSEKGAPETAALLEREGEDERPGLYLPA